MSPRKAAMHKAVPTIYLAILLAAVSHSASAEWVNSGHNDALTAYISPDTIHRSGDRVRMLSLIDHKAVTSNAGMTYLSVKAQHEYDCKKGSVRILFSSAHSENMGKGIIVGSSYNHGDFELIQPRSIVETLWKTACRQR